jgi:hypothetical protein
MSRYASNASGGLAAAAMLDSIARKESSYKEGIKQNHLLAKPQPLVSTRKLVILRRL